MKSLNKKLIKLAAISLSSLTAITAAQAQYATTTEDVNMRAGPSVRYVPIRIIPEDTAVLINKCYRSWCKVKYGRLTGWTSARYLEFERRPAIIEIHEQEKILPDIVIGNEHRHYYHHNYYKHHNVYPHYYDETPHYTPDPPPRPAPNPIPVPADPLAPSAPKPGQIDFHNEQ